MAEAADLRIVVAPAGVVRADRAAWIIPNGADAPGKVLPSSLLPMKVLTSALSRGAAASAGVVRSKDRASVRSREGSGEDVMRWVLW